MKGFICSLLGHHFSWVVDQPSGVVTAVCRRCNRPILCPYPRAESDSSIINSQVGSELSLAFGLHPDAASE